MSKVGYVLYLDEAGDFGLQSIKPLDVSGASEWFVIGGLVVRKSKEHLLEKWLEQARTEARNTQAPILHFRSLSERQKRLISNRLGNLEVRLFVVISNKRNLRQHQNSNAANISQHKHWFYWWMTRLLLERVTKFCAVKNLEERTPNLKLQIEFSKRTDLRLSDFKNYFTRLWIQNEKAFLNKRTINWSVFSFDNVNFSDHKNRPGLQFADVVASAFYQAVNVSPQDTEGTNSAMLLKSRMHRYRNDRYDNEGITLWPSNFSHENLNSLQKDFFRFYELKSFAHP